ncbi:MAG: hypothetical protein ABSF55_00690 [Candidatus Staskawiczbacteria bacterium]|jgi:hypothetical protein
MPNPENREPQRDPFIYKDSILPGTEDSIDYKEEKLRELQNNPNLIVRKESFVTRPDDPNGLEKNIQVFSDHKKYFNELREKYGINIPNFDLVIGETKKGSPAVFIVTDKIDGKSLDRMETFPEEAEKKFEDFYLRLLQALYDAFKNKTAFLIDIGENNFMYGHRLKKEGEENNFFVTDVGSRSLYGIMSPEREHIKIHYDAFHKNVVRKYRKLFDSCKNKFNPSYNFDKIEEKLKEIEEYVDVEE